MAASSSRAEGETGAVLASDWYAEMAGTPLVGVERALADAYPATLLALAKRLPALRGLLVFRRARGVRGLALIAGEPGTAVVLLCEAWLRRRRALVLLELIERRPQHRLRRHVYRAWEAAVLRPALRRALAGAQVLSGEEQRRLAARAAEPGVIRLIPWARSTGAEPAPAQPRSGVLSSGRAWCDWESVFEAARGGDWQLTVVCGAADLERVTRLNRDGRARVLCEIPLDEHERLLRGAAVYALALRPGSPSAGHVRLMAATDAGTAVVATRVATLAGYLEDGVTARTVPAEHPAALRKAIEALLDSPDERGRLADGARAAARDWTYREYFAAIGELIDDSL